MRRGFRAIASGSARLLAVIAVAMGLGSCVHQFPEQEDNEFEVVLSVVQELDWLPDFVMDITRADAAGYNIRYDFRVYPKGNTTYPVKEFTIYKEDLTRQDYVTTLKLMPGDYDLWCWSDYAYAASGEAVYYDDADFSGITYIKPYEGDTDMRDAFRGKTSFTVEDPGMMEPVPVGAEIVLTRPLARYKFIAEDLADFIDRETTRGKWSIDASDFVLTDGGPRWARLNDYTVKVVYPLYMPSVFDNFKNNPIDSWTGVSFDCVMEQLSDTEARLAMDYTYVNGQESSIQVQLEIYDPDGLLIARTATITVPTERDRTTIVRGKFLTTLRNDGVGIDPDFDGDFNIEL